MKPFMILIAVAALAIALAGIAGAEPVPQKARTLASRGRQAHDAGDYVTAISAFKEAYVLAPSGALLFNLAQSYRLHGDCEDAMLMYRRFLSTDPAPEAALIANGHLAVVERCAHPEPIAKTVARAPSAPNVKLPPSPEPLVRSNQHRSLQLGLAIGGVTALGIATVYALDASSAASDVERLYARGAKWMEVQPIDARGHHDAFVAKLWGGVGLLAIGGAVASYAYDRHAERAAAVSIAPTKRGAQVSLSWAF